MADTTSKGKTNPFLLSEQVKKILLSKGLSANFNYSDYEYFKMKAKRAFNKAQTIADFFTKEATKSDFNEYIF